MAALAAIGLVAGIASVTACSGSTAATMPLNDGGADGAVGAEGDAGEKPYTLDDVCDRAVPIVCDLRKPCCESGPGFDLAGCLASARKDCEADVAAARAGAETFHGERIDACIPKFRAIFASCTVTFDLLQAHAREIAECRSFEGQLPEGSPCERDSQCKPSATENTLTACDGDTKTCRTTTLLAEGASCAIAAGLPSICGEGLYCDFDEHLVGTCKKKTSLGVKCDPTKKPFALECGLGNYCDAATSVCTVGKPAETACANDLECASVTCSKPDGGPAGGTCAAPALLVKTSECKGG